MEEINAVRVFLNWRKAFAVFALMAGSLPSEAERDAYFNRLRAQRKVADDG